MMTELRGYSMAAITAIAIKRRGSLSRFHDQEPVARLDKIFEAVCRVFKVTEVDLRQKRGKVNITMARHIFFYVAARISGASLSDIGRYLNKHHTTVMWARDQVAGCLKVGDQRFMPYWNKYTSSVNPHLIP